MREQKSCVEIANRIEDNNFQMYRNNLGGVFEGAQSNHKDSVICGLKKELFELKDLEHDFLRLNDEVASVESKYSLLLDEKERTENEHRIKMDINKKAIGELRGEVDGLKMQMHRVGTQIQETLRENSTLKRMCDNREQEITTLVAANRDLEKANEFQQEENKNLSISLKQLKDERTKNENECERLTKVLDQSISSLKVLEKEARLLESSNTKLDNVLLQAEKDHSCLLDDLRTKEQLVETTNRKLEKLKAEGEDLSDKILKLERECDASKCEYQELCQTLDATVGRNKEATGKLKNLENLLRGTEAELDQGIIKREGLRKEHLDLANHNKTLNNEIDKCLLSILQSERGNKDLQKEVENYIECDEEARNMLNRKEGMRTLLEQVNSKLQKTEQQIAHLR